MKSTGNIKAYPAVILFVFVFLSIFVLQNTGVLFAGNYPDPTAGREAAMVASFLLMALVYMVVDFYFLKKMKGWLKGVGVFLGVIFILLGMEGFLRLYDRANPAVYRPSRALLWEITPGLAGVSGSDGRFQVWSDRYGLRTGRLDADRELSPADGEKLRVLIVGDSTLFGWPLNFEETFAHYLALEYTGTKEIEVLNGAVSGYSSLQGLLYLNERGWSFNPDVLIVGFNNDPFIEPVSDKKRLDAAGRNSTVYSLYSLVLFRVIRGLILDEGILPKREGNGSEAGEPRLSSGEVSRIYEEIIAGAQSRNIRVMILSLPLCDEGGRFPMAEVYRGTMKETARLGGAEFVDFFNTWPRDGPEFLDPVHPGPEGHRLMAREVARRLDLNEEP